MHTEKKCYSNLIFICKTYFSDYSSIMKISDRPEFKSKKPPLTFGENETVLTAVKAMKKDNFGSVVITDKSHKVKGIVTERDLLKKLIPNLRKIVTLKIGF